MIFFWIHVEKEKRFQTRDHQPLTFSFRKENSNNDQTLMLSVSNLSKFHKNHAKFNKQMIKNCILQAVRKPRIFHFVYQKFLKCFSCFKFDIFVSRH